MINLPQVALSTLEDANTLEAIKSILDYLKKKQSEETAAAQAASSAQSESTVLHSGMMMLFPKSSPPAGWIIYTDAPLSRTDYPGLYAIFQNTYSQAGDSGTTFRLPPGCGRALVIAGQGSGLTNRAFGATGGEETHLLTTAEMPSHQHLMYQPSGVGAWPGSYNAVMAHNNAVVDSGQTEFTGGGGSHNNMQPFVTWYAIIKT